MKIVKMTTTQGRIVTELRSESSFVWAGQRSGVAAQIFHFLRFISSVIRVYYYFFKFFYHLARRSAWIDFSNELVNVTVTARVRFSVCVFSFSQGPGSSALKTKKNIHLPRTRKYVRNSFRQDCRTKRLYYITHTNRFAENLIPGGLSPTKTPVSFCGNGPASQYTLMVFFFIKFFFLRFFGLYVLGYNNRTTVCPTTCPLSSHP